MTKDWHNYNEELVNRSTQLARDSIKTQGDRETIDMNAVLLNKIIWDIIRYSNPKLEHNNTVNQIEQIFRKYGFYTTREYPIYKMKDESDRAGRIDLVVRKGKYRLAIEYDHHRIIKWKSFQKVVQIKPERGIVITGTGMLEPNIERAIEYSNKLSSALYVVSLKQRTYKIIYPKH